MFTAIIREGGDRMKVFQINSFGNLSAGSIACGLYKTLNEEGYDGIIAYGRGYNEKEIANIRVSSNWSVLADGLFPLYGSCLFFLKRKLLN